MRFSEAFRETLFRFELTGVEVAAKSGLTTGQISDFRNGKNVRSDSLERILEALPKEARDYMLFLVGQEGEPGHVPLPKSDEQPTQ